MQELCTLKPCAVCSQEVLASDVDQYDILSIPNLALLSTDGISTPSSPRSSKTTVTTCNGTYCLQPAACQGEKADVCKSCYKALKDGYLPEHSLPCYDPGALPAGRTLNAY